MAILALDAARGLASSLFGAAALHHRTVVQLGHRAASPATVFTVALPQTWPATP